MINGYTYKDVAATTAGIVTAPGVLHGMFVNSSSSGTIKIYDSATNANTVMNNTTGTLAVGYYNLGDAAFENGLSVTVGGTLDVTLYYSLI